MKGRGKMGFTVLYALVLVGMLIPTVMTLWPGEASKPNRLGYMSLCSFSPWSTLSMVGIMLLLVGIVYAIQWVVARSA
jgi:hypothetical protein